MLGSLFFSGHVSWEFLGLQANTQEYAYTLAYSLMCQLIRIEEENYEYRNVWNA
jgi:hypothetical protein